MVTLVIPVCVTAPNPSKFNVPVSSPNFDTPSPVAVKVVFAETVTPPSEASIITAPASLLVDLIRKLFELIIEASGKKLPTTSVTVSFPALSS